MDPNIKQSIIDRLKQTNNVLVTVKKNPSVDHLAACIGLTLFLNKQGKHATAVYSGETPSTIEFLKPDNTLEKDTNSLRDFIIALDKSKADKLRYKVEDKVVKIFITPYRTSLSESDLDFSQGDFNVDVVVALGVHQREELDQAIMAHGRILHDATVVSINTQKAADLGALNWHDDKASSLSEMTTSLVDSMQPNSLDEQMATSFLTGIVAETDRFSNEKTSSLTMSLSAKLMAAGANQQLVATKLQEPQSMPSPQDNTAPGKRDGSKGMLEIEHPKTEEKEQKPTSNSPPKPVDNATGVPEDSESIHIDEEGNLRTGLQDEQEEKKDDEEKKPGRLTLDPPTLGGTLTANSQQQPLEPSSDPLSNATQKTRDTLEHKETSLGSSMNVKGKDVSPQSSQTLSSIEEQVGSPHVQQDIPKADDSPTATSGGGSIPQTTEPTDNQQQEGALLDVPAEGVDGARQAVEQAAQGSLQQKPDPLQSLNAKPLGNTLHPSAQDIQQPGTLGSVHEQGIQPPAEQNPPVDSTGFDQSSSDTPPPVPPPMMPPNFGGPSNDQNAS